MAAGERGSFDVALNGRQLLGLLLVALLFMSGAFLMGQRTMAAVADALSPVTQPAPISSVRSDADTASPIAAVPEPQATVFPLPGALYLQVAAGGKADADSISRRLLGRSLEVVCLPVPERPGLVRVLVGPFKDSAEVATAREALTEAGFRGQSALLRKFRKEG